MHVLLLLASLFTLLSPAYSLYFYLEGSQTRCFLEDLPKDTLVVGQFKAEEWNSERNVYSVNSNIGIKITVDVTPRNGHLTVGNIR